MELQDYLRILQSRWKIIAITVVVAVGGALGMSLMTTPTYEASTRLFVSTSAGTSVNELYQGNLYSQQRVTSYTQLLTGETLAQRTIDELGLDETPAQLAAKVTANSAPNSVLVNVRITDTSPERARDIANALSDEFVVMVRELETPENGGAAAARVVVEQTADTPTSPVSPKTKRNLALGLAVGVLLGIALAVLRDRLDNTVKDRGTVEEIAGASTVGTIPFDKEREVNQAVDFGKGQSVSAESFRELRTNLQFLQVDNPPRVIIVTSALPNEGKSTTAVNLALALVESGKSVCLVEGDLRKPRVSKYLGLIGSVGLSNVLAGAAKIDDLLQETPAGLKVLASGPIPPNPSELLGSQAAREVLTKLREQFDYVIVDASPLLPVTDAVVLTALADGAVVVARYGATTRDQLTRAVENLRSVNAKILGTILTMTPARGKNAYEYRYYYESDTAAPNAAVTAPVTGVPAAAPKSDSSTADAAKSSESGTDSQETSSAAASSGKA
ncbi:MAG: polysaccharide biosynthesis tyrosine autokinase [Rhodococcus sp.]|nr:polysaccharide biosynthesis tyrosine autokinase [Rhodococcus sp. (in: high G+C Gram-positive bacteria)]